MSDSESKRRSIFLILCSSCLIFTVIGMGLAFPFIVKAVSDASAANGSAANGNSSSTASTTNTPTASIKDCVFDETPCDETYTAGLDCKPKATDTKFKNCKTQCDLQNKKDFNCDCISLTDVFSKSSGPNGKYHDCTADK